MPPPEYRRPPALPPSILEDIAVRASHGSLTLLFRYSLLTRVLHDRAWLLSPVAKACVLRDRIQAVVAAATAATNSPFSKTFNARFVLLWSDAVPDFPAVLSILVGRGVVGVQSSAPVFTPGRFPRAVFDLIDRLPAGSRTATESVRALLDAGFAAPSDLDAALGRLAPPDLLALLVDYQPSSLVLRTRITNGVCCDANFIALSTVLLPALRRIALDPDGDTTAATNAISGIAEASIRAGSVRSLRLTGWSADNTDSRKLLARTASAGLVDLAAYVLTRAPMPDVLDSNSSAELLIGSVGSTFFRPSSAKRHWPDADWTRAARLVNVLLSEVVASEAADRPVLVWGIKVAEFNERARVTKLATDETIADLSPWMKRKTEYFKDLYAGKISTDIQITPLLSSIENHLPPNYSGRVPAVSDDSTKPKPDSTIPSSTWKLLAGIHRNAEDYLQERDCMETVRLLISAGVDLRHSNILHWLLSRGYSKTSVNRWRLLSELLGIEASPPLSNADTAASVAVACRLRFGPRAPWRRADPSEPRTTDGASPLFVALGEAGDVIAARLLLFAGAPAESALVGPAATRRRRDEFGALHEAARRGHAAAVRAVVTADDELLAACVPSEEARRAVRDGLDDLCGVCAVLGVPPHHSYSANASGFFGMSKVLRPLLLILPESVHVQGALLTISLRDYYDERIRAAGLSLAEAPMMPPAEGPEVAAAVAVYPRR
ncbi:hypothetical protein HK405_007881 [Cladochytrium tenue]|nr:hypothetical protein HK405_007881 [Cladochytrium tenue]